MMLKERCGLSLSYRSLTPRSVLLITIPFRLTLRSVIFRSLLLAEALILVRVLIVLCSHLRGRSQHTVVILPLGHHSIIARSIGSSLSLRLRRLLLFHISACVFYLGYSVSGVCGRIICDCFQSVESIFVSLQE